MLHDPAPPVSAAVPAAASAAVPAAVSTACAHTPTLEVALEGRSGGLGGNSARCRRVDNRQDAELPVPTVPACETARVLAA